MVGDRAGGGFALEEEAAGRAGGRGKGLGGAGLGRGPGFDRREARH